MPHYSVDTITNMRELPVQPDEWNDALRRSMIGGNVFMSYEWISAWWEHYGKQKTPYILLVFEHNGNTKRLVAIAPFFKRRVGPFTGLEIIGKGTSHGIDIVLPGETEVQKESLAALSAELRSRSREWDYIYNYVTDFGYGCLPLLTEEKRSGGLPFVARSSAHVRYLTTTGPWTDYLASKSSHFRKKIRNRCRKMQRDLNADFVEKSGDLSADQIIGLCAKVDEASWKSEDGKMFFAEKELAPFFRKVFPQLLRRGWLKIWAIECPETTVAYALVASNGENAYFYKAGFDNAYSKYSPGTCLLFTLLRDDIFQGDCKRFSLMYGDQDYKDRFADEKVPRQQLYILSETVRGRTIFPIALKIKRKLGSLARTMRAGN